MPSYDLRCRECGNTFSKQLSFAERKNVVCEKCGSKEIEPIFKRCNLMGKGGGGETSSGSSSCSGGCSGCSGC